MYDLRVNLLLCYGKCDMDSPRQKSYGEKLEADKQALSLTIKKTKHRKQKQKSRNIVRINKKNSQYHLLLAEGMFGFDLQLLHILISDLWSFSGASALIGCRKMYGKCQDLNSSVHFCEKDVELTGKSMLGNPECKYLPAYLFAIYSSSFNSD